MATNREQVLQRWGLPKDTHLSLADIAQKSGMPLAALNKVFSRGKGAAVSNLASVRLKKDFSKNPDTVRYPASARLSPVQWGYARVWSFVNKSTTYKTADADIAKEYNI